MKKYLMPALLGLTIILAGCANDPASNETNVKEFVSQMSASNIVESASINNKDLIVQDGGEEDIYNLPEDEFFISVAPYLTYTFPCKFHSLTGGQGELVNEEMHVKIKDEQGDRKSVV